MRPTKNHSGQHVRPTIRVSALAPLLDHLARSHLSESGILSKQGLMASDLADPYAVISMSDYVALFEAASLALNDPSLGLRIGMKIRPADMGPMGVLFSLSGTLWSGLHRLSSYVTALQGGTQSSLFEVGQELVWTYRLSDSTLWPRRQDAEYTLAAVCQLTRSSFASNWRPVEVHFEHGEEADALLLQRLFRAPVLFRQSGNRFILRRDDARKQFRIEDRGLTTILERHIGDLIGHADNVVSVIDSVRALIGVFLGQKPITVAILSKEMRMSPRSLQRHLAAAGTSLRAMLQEHRESLALRHLQEDGARIAHVADALGYADGTVFWRAFRNWTGQEPSEVRRKSKAEKAPPDTLPEG